MAQRLIFLRGAWWRWQSVCRCTKAPNAASNSGSFGPRLRNGVRRTSTTAWMSASEISGRRQWIPQCLRAAARFAQCRLILDEDVAMSCGRKSTSAGYAVLNEIESCPFGRLGIVLERHADANERGVTPPLGQGIDHEVNSPEILVGDKTASDRRYQ